MKEANEMSQAEMLYAGIQLTRPLLRNITSRLEADLEGTGIGVGERAVLEVLLAVGQATAPEITHILEVKRQFTGRLLKDLVERGLLQALPNPKHRTSSIFTLSDESRSLIECIRSTELSRLGEFCQRFSPEEIRAFYEVQRAINAEFSPAEAAISPVS
ncbi:hypothetical protein [Pseudophaeobacter sp.]|uniref:MarR family winged helix-turn-helix transcriptional regulator n=1 Tax=Pseudophaeobacter sp. TaxID=1971739 RepID=UPI00329791E2